jgi:replicative superfamily II helicase
MPNHAPPDGRVPFLPERDLAIALQDDFIKQVAAESKLMSPGQDLYPSQLAATKYMLEYNSISVLSPTGSGKSTTFLLPFLVAKKLMPQSKLTMFYISPLIALNGAMTIECRKYGINCCELGDNTADDEYDAGIDLFMYVTHQITPFVSSYAERLLPNCCISNRNK